jgi:nitrite reductase/ring-hydroxylating ferredoxin subunit
MTEDAIQYVAVAKVGAVEDGYGAKVEALGRSLALFNVEGAFYAIDEICSHAHASLAEGFVIDDTVECPLHGACFSLRTGEALSAPATDPVRTYPVRVEGEDILVGIPSSLASRVTS